MKEHYAADPNPVQTVATKILEARYGEYPKKPHIDHTRLHMIRNETLRELNTIFPDCKTAFLRQLIVKTPIDTVQGVVEQLLALDRTTNGYPKTVLVNGNSNSLQPNDLFQSDEYIIGATHRLYAEYSSHWKSSIRAVLIESNYHYPTAWLKLKEIRAPSWWIPNLFSSSPFSSSVTSQQLLGSKIPEINDPNLLADIHELNNQIQSQHNAKEILELDLQFARDLNQEEYETAGQLITCACCFSQVPFENLAQCSGGGDEKCSGDIKNGSSSGSNNKISTNGPHLVCVECLKSYIQVGLFETGTLRNGAPATCFAVEGCHATIDDAAIQRSVSRSVYDVYERVGVERLLREARIATEEVVMCPFCAYAEVRDDIGGGGGLILPHVLVGMMLRTSARWLAQRFETVGGRELTGPGVLLVLLVSLQLCAASFAVSIRLGWVCLIVLFALGLAVGFFVDRVDALDRMLDALEEEARGRVRRVRMNYVMNYFMNQDAGLLRMLDVIADARRRLAMLRVILVSYWGLGGLAGSKTKTNVPFNCLKCSKASCAGCQKEWTPLHQCFEKEKDSMRLFIEQRVSEAFIRTCPKCSIQFTKLDGCNKITCPSCKHAMCFICRSDISIDKYKHFCQHFRVVPGSRCTECDKCDLYHTDNDEATRRRVTKEAERDWIAQHPEVKKLLQFS